MLKGMRKMMNYKEGQGCPACKVGKLKMIGGDINKKEKGHVVETYLECGECSEKFLDEKQFSKGAILKKA
jgi:hypothetical protein